MKSRSVDSVTSNEELVRLRIFDGVIPLDEGGRELLELERAQHRVARLEIQQLREQLRVAVAFPSFATVSPEVVSRAAAAIANARGMRRGAPAIMNILEILPEKLKAEVLDDAEEALKAALAPGTSG